MPWTCFRLAENDEEAEARFVRAFKRAHHRAGSPPDAAIFRARAEPGKALLVFPPAAVNLAAATMHELGLPGGPVAMERPERVDVQVFGNVDARKRLFGG